MDDVFGLVRSGLPPSKTSPSACNTMNDDRAVVNESTSGLPFVGRPVLRMLVNERVRGSADDACHILLLRFPPSVVGLASGVLNGLAFVEWRIAAERMDALRPRLPLPE